MGSLSRDRACTSRPHASCPRCSAPLSGWQGKDELTSTRTQILALSRENTNVRSLSISLNEKRKAMLVCQDSLNALRQAILAEPTARAMYGPPAKPR
jgi:hypothetical protein